MNVGASTAVAISAVLAASAASVGDARAGGVPTPSVTAAEADCSTEERIDERFSNGARWEFCVESRVRENLVLKHVTYTPPGGEPFAVLASASLAQLHVAYDDNDVTYNDITQYGLGGGYLIELTAEDCPSGSLIDVRTRPGICRSRRSGGDGYRSATRAVETESVELYSVSQVGAYAYVQSWTFHDDGAIEPAIGATGALQRSSSDTALPFGRVLSGDPDALWLSHTHNYHWRLDFDVGDEATDDVVTETRHPLAEDGRRARSRERFESETARRIEPGTLQAWHVWERDPAGADEEPRGFAIEPGHHGHRFERTDVEPHTAFDVFVTVGRDCERFASQNARYNPDCLDHVLQYADDAEPLVGADLVLWHRVGFHHVPRDEDQRHMHSHWDGFVIEPVNVSRSNPAVRSGDNTPPELGPLPSPRGVVGEDVDARLEGVDADGDALAFGAENLPPGITLDPDGPFSGRPDVAGEWRVRVSVDDGRDVVTDEFVWQVTAPAASETSSRRRGGAPSAILLAALGLAFAARRRPGRRRRG